MIPKAIAYSYTRFSHPDQKHGDSFRRQIQKRDEWCKRNKVILDTSESFEDEGVSAYHGDHRQNPDRHALAEFLERVKAGRIRRGSYLIVESLDRLSREHIRPALTLLLNLIDAGIRIVQILPVEATYDEKVEPMQLMMAIMELSRGNSESRMKSERVGSAWQDKKRRAAKNGEVLTARGPAWLRLVNGKWEVIDEAADAIRQIYRWAIDGYGIKLITRRLNTEGVPIISHVVREGHATKEWAWSYVHKILTNPAVYGSYQPYKGRAGKRKPDGKPIAGYYPAVISEADWYAAQGAMASRRERPGRPASRQVNVFVGLLHDALNGQTLQMRDRGEKGRPILESYAVIKGLLGAKLPSFPFEPF